MLSKYKLLIVSIFVCSNFNLLAQTYILDSIEIETISVSATRISTNAGFKQMQIDSAVLADYKHTSIAQLLSENSHIHIKTYGHGGLATSSFRGTNATHTQVSWNGIGINSHMLGQSDFSLIPANLIDEVTLFHGGTANAEHSGALGGTINLSNKPNWKNKINANIGLGFGSFGTYSQSVTFGIGKNKFQSKTRIFNQNSANSYEYSDEISIHDSTITQTRKNADFQHIGMIQELYYRHNLENLFSVKIWLQDSKKNIPGPIGTTTSNRAESQNNLIYRAIAQWKILFANSKLETSAAIVRDDLTYKLDFAESELGDINNSNSALSAIGKLSYSHEISDKTQLVVNLTNHWSQVDSENYNQIKTRNLGSISVSVTQNFWQRLQIYSMLKQEIVNEEFTPIIPSLGLELKLHRNKEIYLKSNITKNYRQPTLNDLFWNPGGNINLQNEEGITSELGLDVQRIYASKFMNLSGELTTYYNSIENWILWQPSEFYYWTPRNVKNVKAFGFEASIKVSTIIKKSKITIETFYTFTSTKNTKPAFENDNSVDKQLIYIPLHKANGNIRINLSEFILSWSLQYTSWRFTNIDNTQLLPAYSTQDINFLWHKNINRLKIGLSLRIENVFNKKFESQQYYPMPGRYFHFSINFSYQK